MNRLSTWLLCAGAFFLAGCPHRALVMPQVAEQVLVPLYTEALPHSPKYLKFSEKGGTFIVAGIADFIYLYDAAAFEKRTEIRKETQKENEFPYHSFYIRGVGYIDDNTWYTATETRYATTENLIRNALSGNAALHIRQIEPMRELHKYDQNGLSDHVLANATHVADERTLMNWHDGSTYEIAVAHPGFGYGLTPDSLVVSHSFRGSVYWFHDPVKQNGFVWDVGGSPNGIPITGMPNTISSGNLILSSDAKYGLVTSGRGKCELWQLQLPQKELLGQCGRSSLFGGKHWRGVAFTRDSRAFAIATENEIFVYTTQPFRQVMATTLAHNITALTLEADRLAVADESGAIFVWDTGTGRLLGEYHERRKTNRDATVLRTRLLDFQPGGTKLLAAQTDYLMVFDLSAGR